MVHPDTSKIQDALSGEASHCEFRDFYLTRLEILFNLT